MNGCDKQREAEARAILKGGAQAVSEYLVVSMMVLQEQSRTLNEQGCKKGVVQDSRIKALEEQQEEHSRFPPPIPSKRVRIGKWFDASGYRASDIVLILLAVAILVSVTFRVDKKLDKWLGNGVQQEQKASVPMAMETTGKQGT